MEVAVIDVSNLNCDLNTTIIVSKLSRNAGSEGLTCRSVHEPIHMIFDIGVMSGRPIHSIATRIQKLLIPILRD